MLVGKLSQSGQKAVRRNPHPAFALDRLDHDCGRFVVNQPGHGVEIAKRCIDKTGHQRPQSLVILGLGRRGQRPERAAMEAAFKRDDLVAMLGSGVQPNEFDGRLVRLGSRVAEKCLTAETSFR